MPEAYAAPHADQPNDWPVATACDIRLGKILRGNEATRGYFIDINAEAIRQTLSVLSNKGNGSILFTAAIRDSEQPKITLNYQDEQPGTNVSVEVGEAYQLSSYVPSEMRDELALKAYDRALLKQPELFAHHDQGSLRQKARERVEQDLDETKYRVYRRNVLQELCLASLVDASDFIARSQSTPRSKAQKDRRDKLETLSYRVAPSAVASLATGMAAYELSGRVALPLWVRLIGAAYVALETADKTLDIATNLSFKLVRHGTEARRRKRYTTNQVAKQLTANIIAFKPLATQEMTDV